MNRWLQPVVWILVVTCTLLVTVVATAFYPYLQSNQDANHHSYPPGFYQPQRGFGKVWCEQAEVRDRLGWATKLETGYDTAVQDDSAPKYTTRYIRAADGNVWKLLPERSGWEKIILP